MKVVKIDKAATDYYIKLTNLQSEYRRIGVITRQSKLCIPDYPKRRLLPCSINWSN